MKNNSLSQLLYSLATAAGMALGMASMATAQPGGELGADTTPRTTRTAPAPVHAHKSKNIAHTNLPPTFAGDYVLDPAKAAGVYNDPKEFGKTVVMLPDSNPASPTFGQLVPMGKPVADLHYVLERNQRGQPTKIGMRMIPISEPHMELAAGEEPDPKKPGSHLIDAFIRKAQNLGPNDPIFATIVYLHPEKHSGDIGQLASEALKTEHGQTHLGMYLGKGFTRNSPETYHNKGWKVKGYPATVQLISMAGTPQATLNQNGQIASAILNDGVQFPNDYKNDVYQTITLGRTLAFYRGWLEGDSKLKTDNAWKTYCAEHVTIVTNIMVNVPHNAASFTEIWGADGPALLALAKQKFKAATGQEMVETSFEPLWKKDGLTNPAKIGAGDEVRQDEIGPGLAWPPQHNSDLVRNFLEVYASWPNVGAPASASALMGFKETIVKRMANNPAEMQRIAAEFDKLAIPVMQKMFVYEAMTKKPEELPAYMTNSMAQLYVAVGGKPQDLMPGGNVDPARMGLVNAVKAGLLAKKSKIQRRAGKYSVAQCYNWFKQSITPQIRASHKIDVASPNQVVRYNSPPAVTHRVATGLHPIHPKLKIEEVATVFEAEELITKEELKQREAAAAAAAGGNGLGLTDAMNNANGTNND